MNLDVVHDLHNFTKVFKILAYVRLTTNKAFL